MTLVTMDGGAIVYKAQKIGLGAECCCGCPCNLNNIAAAGITPHFHASATIPNNPNDCTAGTYTVDFDLSLAGPVGGAYSGMDTFAIPGGGTGTIIGVLGCGYCYIFLNVAGCTLGNGAFIGAGPSVLQVPAIGNVVINDECVPDTGSFSYTEPNTGVFFSFDFTYV